MPNSGTSAANPKIKSPPAIKTTPVIITRIAIIVTASGRCLIESLSVLYHVLVITQEYNLIG
jgi:hypothetical protein